MTDLRTSHSTLPGSFLGYLLVSVALVFIVVANIPAFLRMGLDSDTIMYDVCARQVARGHVHYRDQLETNFPGIVWIHLGIRAALGDSSEVLRIFDLVVLATSIFFLARWNPSSKSAGEPIIVMMALASFYFSTSEWCHCQRDFWMLPPALAAAALRNHRMHVRLGTPSSVFFSMMEGVLWAVACWIKPHAALVGAACWIASRIRLRTIEQSAPGSFITDAAGLFAGGLMVLGTGIAWLVQTGAWNSFVDVMTVWNREYVAFDSTLGHRWEFLLSFVDRFSPWVFAHLLAVPLAILNLVTFHQRLMIPAAFYLCWTAQAFLVQQPYDYIRAVTIFVAVGFVSASLSWMESARVRSLALCLLVLMASTQIPLAVHRLRVLASNASTSDRNELRDQLTLTGRVKWKDLQEIIEYLRSQKVSEGEVTSFSLSTIPIYWDLGVGSSTRFVFLHDHLTIFKSRRTEIRAALASSQQKYLVCDLHRFGSDKLRSALESKRTAPFADRIVLQCGPYVIFRLTGQETLNWLDEYYGPIP